MSFITEVGRKRLIQIAEWLEAGAPHQTKAGIVRFDLSVGVQKNACGTACCIAGAVCQFNKPFDTDDLSYAGDFNNGDAEVAFYGDDEDSVFGRAVELLGISEDDAEALFTPTGVDWYRVTPAEAAATIRHYLETGEVNWE